MIPERGVCFYRAIQRGKSPMDSDGLGEFALSTAEVGRSGGFSFLGELSRSDATVLRDGSDLREVQPHMRNVAVVVVCPGEEVKTYIKMILQVHSLTREVPDIILTKYR